MTPPIQRTFSDPQMERPHDLIRKKSLFNLRNTSTPQIEKKHTFRKRSNTRTSDDQLLEDFRQQTRALLDHEKLKSKEKALINQILEIATTPDNLLILLRQFIQDPALRDLFAPESAFKKLQGIPEILVLPVPDVKGFKISECSRMFTSNPFSPPSFLINGKQVHFTSDDSHLAVKHFLFQANSAGWEFQEDEIQKSVEDILNDRATRCTKLLQAASMHAPGDAILLLRERTNGLEVSHELPMPIEFFIHSNHRFCVIYRVRYRIEETALLISTATTYNNGEWTSALYLTNIKGESLKAIDELKKMRLQQQSPASVDYLFAKHPPFPPCLETIKAKLAEDPVCPPYLLEVHSLEVLHVLNETLNQNRLAHQIVCRILSKEHVRALSTFKKKVHLLNPREAGPLVSAKNYLESDQMFAPLVEHLLTPLEKEYTLEVKPYAENLKIYETDEGHFTLTLEDKLFFSREGKYAWSCNRYGVVTYWRGHLQAAILLTNISPFEHHHEKKHLEAYFKNYEKACIPAFYKKSS